MLAVFRQLTDAEKLRKVVVELVDTERTYVKHLSYLMQVKAPLIITLLLVILLNLSSESCSKMLLYFCRPTWNPWKARPSYQTQKSMLFLETSKRYMASSSRCRGIMWKKKCSYVLSPQFLQTLENALETEAQFYNLDSPSQFKVSYIFLLNKYYRSNLAFTIMTYNGYISGCYIFYVIEGTRQ